MDAFRDPSLSATQLNYQARPRAQAPSPSPPRPPSLPLPSNSSAPETPSLPSSSSSPTVPSKLRAFFDPTSTRAKCLSEALIATQEADKSTLLATNLSDATHVVVNPHSTYGEGLVRARASFFSSSSALASTFFPSLVSLDSIEDSVRLRKCQKESGYLYPPSGLVEKEIVAVREELEGSWNGSALHALFVCFCSPVPSLNFLVLRSSRYASLTEEELNDMERFLLETRTVREDGEEQQPQRSITSVIEPSSSKRPRLDHREDSNQHSTPVASSSTSTRLPQPSPLFPTAPFPLELAPHLLQPYQLPRSSHSSHFNPPVPPSSSPPLEPPAFLHFGVASSFASPSSPTCWACGSIYNGSTLFIRLELAEPCSSDPLVVLRFARTICSGCDTYESGS
ncbi:hypothetical protein BDY24DRAFT_443391 [Mrakia frigida]|uniref:uncharacterized protein n=1 Tax=Mrakia frigida TaxID=29902 RepID=UPI003FCC2484